MLRIDAIFVSLHVYKGPPGPERTTNIAKESYRRPCKEAHFNYVILTYNYTYMYMYLLLILPLGSTIIPCCSGYHMSIVKCLQFNPGCNHSFSYLILHVSFYHPPLFLTREAPNMPA